MTVYFVTIGLRDEIEIIRKLRPPHLLCSYWYFKNKDLREFCNSIGYRPKIFLDSGAYSAHTKGKSVNLFEYMKYIKENAEYITKYISLDVIGDSFSTKAYYDIMRHKGFEPVPVYHYGDSEETINYYARCGVDFIALGNTVTVIDKEKVARWCVSIKEKYPEIAFHLLGSSSRKIMECGALESCDSSAWYMMAVNGKPKNIPGKKRLSKIERASVNMAEIMEVFNEVAIPVNNRGS